MTCESYIKQIGEELNLPFPNIYKAFEHLLDTMNNYMNEYDCEFEFENKDNIPIINIRVCRIEGRTYGLSLMTNCSPLEFSIHRGLKRGETPNPFSTIFGSFPIEEVPIEALTKIVQKLPQTLIKMKERILKYKNDSAKLVSTIESIIEKLGEVE